MNKTAIKNFAVWARNKLIADITYKAGLIGVSENGIAQPLPQSSKDLQFFDIGTKDYTQVAGAEIGQRNALVRAIQEKESTSDYNTAFKAIIEEVAYTWFNRLIAIRFMEVNDYLPSRIRVLSSENPAKNEPDFVTTPFDTDMEFTVAEQDKIMQLKDENKLDELFRMLFIKQCNKLHEILPELFEETNNYTEMLLSISFTDSDGAVYHLVHDIDEKDFDITTQDEDGKTPGQVEIIGWMYQYYNIEPKDETFALLKKNVKITKERIPAATQLFTPDWIVRYMVENSLGRLWVEGHPNDSLKENWKYYLEEAEQEASVQEQLEQIRAEYRNLNPEDIKVIDPCMGSGHILVYCFDVLMQIYESQGYTQRDAAQSILENNLYGLDIDKRAAQLAYFAVMMKARQYDRRIFTREIKPHVYDIEESNGINRGQLKYFGADLSPVERNKAMMQITGLLDAMIDAKKYGSILNIENYDWYLLRRFAKSVDDGGQITLDILGIDNTKIKLLYLIELGIVLSQKYYIVVTNPPYMGIANADSKLGEYVKENYPENKVDLFSVFMERAIDMLCVNGYCSLITQQTWMFISSFKQTREMLRRYKLTSLNHLGRRAFEEISGEVVQSVVYCLQKIRISAYNAVFVKLDDVDSKEEEFTSLDRRYTRNIANFEDLPDGIYAYWLAESVSNSFKNYPAVSNLVQGKIGLQTGDNTRFLRLWHEVDWNKISLSEGSENEYWIPYNKAGGFRRWYGNHDYVLNWRNEGFDIINCRDEKGKLKSRPQNREFYFKSGITWSDVCTGLFSMRKMPKNFVFDSCAPTIFASKENESFLLGLYNSKVAQTYLDFLAPTIHYTCGSVLKMPYIKTKDFDETIVNKLVELAKIDWDAFETSWDFQRHPFVENQQYAAKYHHGELDTPETSLPAAYSMWQVITERRFQQLKTNEEELNRIFIDIYGLQEELTPEVEDKDVTVRKADLARDIRSFISYAVGCMLGRYSLDDSGICYAGGEWDDRKYSTFIPDKDNCIPITDEEYFEDDIVALFVVWIKKVYGAESLEENLDFIAKALGNKGATSREVIRNYFLNDFMKDHIKIYQKRPIYWLFDSGKQKGFKALVYMHRWNADTVGNLRVEYLHKMQHIYEREIGRMQETIDNSRNSREISKATKRKDKLQKQLKETKDYDAKLAHIALSRIEIDLDDGVKVNYEKVQTGRDGKKMQILVKI